MKKMISTVKALKHQHGYKEYPDKNVMYPVIHRTLLQKQVESDSVCELNGKLHININLTVMDVGGDIYKSYSVNMKAEKNDMWWNFECYAIQEEKVLLEITEIENKLIKLFNQI